MREMTPLKDRLLGFGLCLLLVAVVACTAYQVAMHGSQFVHMFSEGKGVDDIIGEALAFFVVGATDWPAAFRRGPITSRMRKKDRFSLDYQVE
jgi:hypothetical protein